MSIRNRGMSRALARAPRDFPEVVSFVGVQQA